MNRRDTIKVFGGGVGFCALTGVSLAVPACTPTETPAAEADPLLDLIREYRAQLAIYNASGHLTSEEDDALAEATMNPPWNRLRDDCPVPTTMGGSHRGHPVGQEGA